MEKIENSETAQKILEAALSLWSEKGYEESTMRELARRLGMGVSSLYFYFPSKEDIVQYLYRRLEQQVREQFKIENKKCNIKNMILKMRCQKLSS